MKIEAKIVAHSLIEQGHELMSVLVTMPRWILAELNTHRMFSRNSASSRAIPAEKMLQSLEDNPFVPVAWQKEHKGMQGKAYFSELEATHFELHWRNSATKALIRSRALAEDGLTKQITNRQLEPYMWHTVIITASEWANFFAQRCPLYTDDKGNQYRSRLDYIADYPLANQFTDLKWRDINMGQAEIHMMDLAEAIWDAKQDSEWKELKHGEWHIPYGAQILEDFELSMDDLDEDNIPIAVKISSVMCARTSYTVAGHDLSEWTVAKYLQKCSELCSAKPLHASPLEHCAKAMFPDEYSQHAIVKPLYNKLGDIIDTIVEYGWCGNFRGFRQFRKMLSNENITE